MLSGTPTAAAIAAVGWRSAGRAGGRARRSWRWLSGRPGDRDAAGGQGEAGPDQHGGHGVAGRHRIPAPFTRPTRHPTRPGATRRRTGRRARGRPRTQTEPPCRRTCSATSERPRPGAFAGSSPLPGPPAPVEAFEEVRPLLERHAGTVVLDDHPDGWVVPLASTPDGSALDRHPGHAAGIDRRRSRPGWPSPARTGACPPAAGAPPPRARPPPGCR